MDELPEGQEPGTAPSGGDGSGGQPEAPPAPQSRTRAFQQGHGGAGGASLTDSEKYNALVPKSYRPSSVLVPLMPSGIGMSAGDAERRLPGGQKLPSPNGVSQDNYNAAVMLRLMGSQ